MSAQRSRHERPPVIITCWSVKGGSGTTVVAATLGLLAARSSATLMVDLVGDLPAVLGINDQPGGGVGDWLDAGQDHHALRALERKANPSLSVIPAGNQSTAFGEPLAAALRADGRTVVVDAGVARSGPGLDLATNSTLSLMVLRPCYLALRRAAAARSNHRQWSWSTNLAGR